MPNLNPRVIGDLPYPNRSATTNVDLNVGEIISIGVDAAGTGYVVGAPLTIPPPGNSAGTQATAEVETITVATGAILTVLITNSGTGYSGTVSPTIPSATTQATFNAAGVQALVPAILGRIYTTDSAGRLLNPPTAASVVDLTNGVLSARATTVTGDGFTKVQVVTPPTRVLLKDKAGGLKINDKVSLGILAANLPDQESVVIGSTTFDPAHVGRVFEIDTKNPDGSKKLVGEAGDLLVIDMGVSQ